MVYIYICERYDARLLIAELLDIFMRIYSDNTWHHYLSHVSACSSYKDLTNQQMSMTLKQTIADSLVGYPIDI